MFSRFFIDRPIFAAVLSIFLIIAGLAAIRTLPVAQYPEVAPPVISIGEMVTVASPWLPARPDAARRTPTTLMRQSSAAPIFFCRAASPSNCRL